MVYRKHRRKHIMDAREMGRKGGRARAKAMTQEERRAGALKASLAAKEARKRKAEEKERARKDGSGRGK